MAVERFRISVLAEAKRLKQVITGEKQQLEIEALIHELNATPFDVHRLYNVMRRLRSLQDDLSGKVKVKVPSYNEVKEVIMSIAKVA